MAANRRSMFLRVLWAALAFCFATSANAAINVDFRQDANADAGFTVGDAHWLNSVVQSGNAVYFEGMSLSQRVILDSLPGTNAAGTQHSITFHHQWTKGGTHAFDWLTSWLQAETAGTAELKTYYDGNVVMNVISFRNGIDIAASLLPVTVALTAAGGNHNVVSVPDDAFVSANSGSPRAVQSLINAYELAYGNRTIDLYTDQPLAGAPTLTLAHTDSQGNTIANQTDTGDTYVTYKLSWTTTVKSTQAVIWMAAHIAVGNDSSTLVNLAPGGWGLNKGASQINGGPYHFSLDLADNKSVGSQDNQLKGSSIRALPVCDLTGPASLCPGGTATYSVPATQGITYTWTLTNNSNNATFVGSTTGNSVQVQAGTGCATAYTVCVKVTDSTGLSNTCCIPVSVNDTENPTITCPALGPYQCVGDVPAPYSSLSSFKTAGGTAGDNCDTSLTFSLASSTALTNACGGSLTRTYRVTDDCGNYAECTQTIVVKDTTNPTASNPSAVTVQCKGNVPAADPAVVTDEADNCSTPTVTFVSDSSDGKTCPETITRTYKVTDACGNFINVTQTITVKDTTKPTASNPAPVTVQCAGLVPPPDPAVVTDEADNCSTPTVTFVSDSSDGKSCPETITRTYKVTDACGNFINVTQTITVKDTVKPELSGQGADATIECPATPDFTAPTATDNCDAHPAITFNDETTPGSCAGNYTVKRTWTATDACGNSSQVSQTITVQDTKAPDASCATSATVTIADPKATDDCSGPPSITFARSDGKGASDPYPVNTPVTVTFTITDACGNKATCVYTVNITK